MPISKRRAFPGKTPLGTAGAPGWESLRRGLFVGQPRWLQLVLHIRKFHIRGFNELHLNTVQNPRLVESANSEPVDTNEGLEHWRTLVSKGVLQPVPHGYQGTTIHPRSCARSAPPEGDRTRLGHLSTAFQLLVLFWPHTRNSPDLRPWPLPTSSSSFSWKTWLLCLSFALLKQVLHYPYFIILTGVNSASQMGHKQPAKGLALKSLNIEDWIELAIQ